MDENHIELVLARPFIPVHIKPKLPRGRPRAAVRLNVVRSSRGGEYDLLLIPYTETEMVGRRRARTRDVSSLLPDEPGVEGIDYGARPARIQWPKRAHLQFVRRERVDTSREGSPWAG
jgi:hypothetical protein